ncbi:MAG: PIG-L family deacetylase [Hyphomicrobium sp.]
MSTLFLFAHQDDEIGVLHEIAEGRRRGEQITCAYMTNGAWAGVTSERRNAESLAALAALGVTRSDAIFLGTSLAIPDGRLVENLERALDGVCQLIEQRRSEGHDIRRIVMHAWEGGHHDHDAVHLLGLAAAHRHGLIDTSRQFPLYRRPSVGTSMAFAAPLDSNGPVEKTHIQPLRRLAYLRILTNYSSQIRVILRLLPHILRDYVTVGAQKLQPVSLSRVREIPNAQPMLYEVWKLYTYDAFRNHTEPFIARHLPIPCAPSAASERIA